MKKLLQLITVAIGVFMILRGAYAQEGSTQIIFKDVHVEPATYVTGQLNSKAMRASWTEPVSKNSHLKLSGEYATDDFTFKQTMKAQASVELLF